MRYLTSTSKTRSAIITTAAAGLMLSGCALSGGNSANEASSSSSSGPAAADVTYAADTPLAAGAAGACTPNNKPASEQKIAYVPPSSEFIFYLAVGKGIEARAAELGADYTMIAPSTDNVATQLGMIQDAATRGSDAIILNTHDQDAAAPVVKAATAQGIAIFLVNSDLPDFPVPVQGVIGYKQRSEEEKLGEYAAKDTTTAVKYGIIEGAPGYFNDERTEGFKEGVATNPNFEYVAGVNGQWTVAGGNTAAQDLMQAHPEITMLFAPNDDMAQGAVQALKALGRDDVKIYGTDGSTNVGLEEIAAGTITATLDTKPFQMGQIAAQAAIDCLTGKLPGGAFIDSPSEVVDKTNVNAILCKPEMLYPAPNKQYSCSA